MKVAIIKYNAGNIQSVLFALERIGIQATVTDNTEEIRTADKIIFPGVGEASTAMHYLRERKLDQLIVSLKQPVLGICLGMQLLCSHSEEGDTNCLSVFEKISVKKFISVNNKFKIPQIGWNTVSNLQSKLFTKVAENSYCYFVHSYYAEESKLSIAKTNYIQPYSSALTHNNFYGVQFHPEKSAAVGEQILKNFLDL
ncbi:MAG: imidazole glycerol phosphate synthase subunit HisH [Chitinophagaceae bacterium]|nr:imidazole glycerol phosphate synthase subunit HisH [Chitinophagaceae bacterium]MBK8311718.1 imidazole glycerol phosphate synthase subunit HisH [Chitinophagaceae bacterium]MBK8605838.1 imidazole glycerol phosphate synthase subunit HisH [Chitinophagaceae bacterium]MBP6476594.1 imidazole glycerol phosphate synthase subunit HisH [Chitinophagaceae bacterium]MBP7108248.1 imidazole glycerol phosphate synthase subunit HisH [Chitinophagaceae bacterium]